jgi:RNA polymerase sigma-70 factor (ECF subfamily)
MNGMRDVRLVQLFDRYRTRGDVEALARVFDEVAPSLLKVARHIDGRGAEAEDLVQTTFLVAIERASSFDASRPLVPWLMGILINQSRLARRRRKRAEPIAVPEERADPSRELEIENRELALAVVKALGELPAVYREVLLPHLTQGLEPREIAALLGRPHGTVRAQLHRGIRMMRRLLPAGFAAGAGAALLSRTSLAGVREAVLAAAQVPARSTPAPRSSSLPAALRPARHALRNAGLASIAVVIAALVYLAVHPHGARDSVVALDGAGRRDRESARVAALEAPESELRVRASIAPAPASESAAAPAATCGELHLCATRASDHAPAAGVRVTVLAWGDEQWYAHVIESVTGDDGCASIAAVHAGRVGIHLDHGKQTRVTVEPGQRTDVEIELARGVDVRGRVVDRDGNAIVGATVEACERAAMVLELPPADVEENADAGSTSNSALEMTAPDRRGVRQPSLVRAACSTGADGTFALIDLDPRLFVSARAAGRTSSELCWLESPRYLDRDRIDLEIVLADAAALRGRVVGPDGTPVARATVRVARDVAPEPHCAPDGSVRLDASIARAITDARGEFAVDAPSGAVRVRVDARGFAPFSMRLADAALRADVRLERGAIVRGTVRTPDGAPADGALVSARATTSSLAAGAMCAETRCDADGAFVLRHVPSGTIMLSASAHGYGEPTSTVLVAVDGQSATWDPLVVPEEVIRGTAIGADRRPVALWLVKAEPADERTPAAELSCDEWMRLKLAADPARDVLQCWTDAQGRFTVPCRGRAPHRLELRPRSVWRGAPHASLDGVPPGARDVELRYESTSAWLRGRLAPPHGTAAVACDVIAVHVRNGSSTQTTSRASTGEFALGPLPEGRYEIFAWQEQRMPQRLGTFDVTRGETLDIGPFKVGGTE